MCTRALHALVSRTTWLKKIGVGQLISCGDWLRIRGFYLRCQGRLILYSFGFWQFCSTRKSAQQAAQMLVKDARFIINSQHRQRLAGKSVSKRCLCPEPHWIRVRRAKNWFYPREQYREQISALECIQMLIDSRVIHSRRPYAEIIRLVPFNLSAQNWPANRP